MAPGRRNRGSRHCSHRHKQQKHGDLGDSNTEKDLRGCLSPKPHINPSLRRDMETLPLKVEGPLLLKHPGLENVDGESHRLLVGKRRNESTDSINDAQYAMDRWDGGGDLDEAAALAFFGVTDRSYSKAGNRLCGNEATGEIDERISNEENLVTMSVMSSQFLEPTYLNPIASEIHISSATNVNRGLKTERLANNTSADFLSPNYPFLDGSGLAKARALKSLVKYKESGTLSSSATSPIEIDKKRVRKGNLPQKYEKEDTVGGFTKSAKKKVYGSLEKGTGTSCGVSCNPELEKELGERTHGNNEGLGDREVWRDSVEDRVTRGSCHQQDEMNARTKDEKSQQNDWNNDVLSSSSRHRDGIWKSDRHEGEKNDEESVNDSGGCHGLTKHEREQVRRFLRDNRDAIFEVKVKDSKQEAFVLINKENLEREKSKESARDLKDNKGKHPDCILNEGRSKENRYRDEKERDTRCKTDFNISRDKRVTGECFNEDHCNQHKEQRATIDLFQDDMKCQSENVREGESKLMATPEYNWKVGHEKVDKNGDNSVNLFKSKQDRDRGDPEQEYKARNREDLRFDAGMDGRGKKRSERDPDFNVRYNKQHIEEVGNGKLQDDKDTSEKQSTGLSSSRHNQYKNGKQCEDSLKYRKVHDGNCRERDSWSLGGRVGREKVKDGGKRQTSHRDASHGRRWGGTMRDERTKNIKDIYDRQQHLREMEERQRYSVFDVSKQRQEKGTEERMLSEKSKGERHEDIPIPVFERLGSIKEKNRLSDEGDMEIMHVSSDKGYHQFGKKYKDHDRQTKSKFCFDSNRESANYGTAKGDPRVSKASRSASLQEQELQEQEPMPISESKELCAAENLLKRSPDSNMFEAAVPADNDFLRTRGRHVEEILHETSGWKSKFGPSLSASSGARDSQDKCSHAMNHGEQGKSVGPDEYGRSWESNVVDRDLDDERWRSHDHEKIGGNSSPRRPQDWGHCDFARTSEAAPPKDSTISKRKYEGFSQSSLGPIKHTRMEGSLTEKPEWSHHSHQGNHIPPDVHMGRSLSLNHYVGSTTLLPPFRSGVDNSSIIDTSGDLIGVSNSRDVGRYDRRVGGCFRRPEIVGPSDTWDGFGMGYSHNQGPVAAHGGLFPSFPQTGLRFLGIGPHLRGPQVFGPDGVRPMSMGFGNRFCMGDGFSSFSSHAAADYAPALGWQRYSDGHNSYRPLSGFMHGWEGSGFYRDEHQSFNHSDWDQFSHGITGGWDGISEPSRSQLGEAACDDARVFCQKEGLYQARTEDYALRESDTRKVQVVYDNISETPEFTHALTTCIPDSFVSKASKRFKERLKKLLQHAKIHRTLIDTELYKEYLSFLPTAEVGNRETFVDDHMDISSIFVDDDLEYEGDSDAQDLLSNVTPSPSIFPSLSFKRYEEALRVFQRSSEKDRIQKSKFGSFLLPQCISGIVTSNSNSKFRQGVHRNIQSQTHASNLTVGSTLDPGSVRLGHSRLVEKESSTNAAECCIKELDGVMVADTSTQNGLEGIPIFPHE